MSARRAALQLHSFLPEGGYWVVRGDRRGKRKARDRSCKRSHISSNLAKRKRREESSEKSKKRDVTDVTRPDEEESRTVVGETKKIADDGQRSKSPRSDKLRTKSTTHNSCVNQEQPNCSRHNDEAIESKLGEEESAAADGISKSPPRCGQRVSVYWEKERRWIRATVSSVDPSDATVCVRYESNEESAWHDLATLLWRDEDDVGRKIVLPPKKNRRILVDDDQTQQTPSIVRDRRPRNLSTTKTMPPPSATIQRTSYHPRRTIEFSPTTELRSDGTKRADVSLSVLPRKDGRTVFGSVALPFDLKDCGRLICRGSSSKDIYAWLTESGAFENGTLIVAQMTPISHANRVLSFRLTAHVGKDIGVIEISGRAQDEHNAIEAESPPRGELSLFLLDANSVAREKFWTHTFPSEESTPLARWSLLVSVDLSKKTARLETASGTFLELSVTKHLSVGWSVCLACDRVFAQWLRSNTTEAQPLFEIETNDYGEDEFSQEY